MQHTSVSANLHVLTCMPGSTILAKKIRTIYKTKPEIPGTANGEIVFLPLAKNQEFHDSFLFLPHHCPQHPLKAAAAQLTRCHHWQLSDSVLFLKSRLLETVPLEQIHHHCSNGKMIAENSTDL